MAKASQVRSGSVNPAARPADLDDRRKTLGSSIASARRRHEPPPDEPGRGNALGVAFKIVTEFVAGIVVGGGVGWFLDDWLGTSPIFFLLFFALGAAAGMMNVFRQAYRMNRDLQVEANKDDTAGDAGQQ